jgi:hypothetical protein
MMNLRRMRWAGHVARIGEEQNAYRAWMAKPEGKGQPVRYNSWWDDNIKMDLKYNGRV